MTPDIKALRKLLEAASPGPWSDWQPLHIGAADPDSSVGQRSVARVNVSTDAALIVAAVNALPALLTRLEALESVADAAAEYVDAAEKARFSGEWTGVDAVFRRLARALASVPT